MNDARGYPIFGSFSPTLHDLERRGAQLKTGTGVGCWDFSDYVPVKRLPDLPPVNQELKANPIIRHE